ncbi:hypothetical protein [Mycobacterium dioxanotrophicus]|uniref:hypothetical protein n=1 Tax=Mycobacterium dioxanotrophicus TaxID=482462 RepID=UPI0018DFDA1F|nr:hypothetical protein [Mycobacterium dioxanotrophicus]
MSDVVERAKAALEGVTPEPWDVRDGFIYPLAIRCGLGAIRPQDADFIAAARTLVPELVAELERARRACRRLGEVVESQCRMALDASGLHHLIDEDGDGDWGLIWERLAELGAEVERLKAREDAVAEASYRTGQLDAEAPR